MAIKPEDIDLSPIVDDVASRFFAGWNELSAIEQVTAKRPLVPVIWNALPSLLAQVEQLQHAQTMEAMAAFVVPDTIEGL